MRAIKIPLTCRETRKRLGTRVAILTGGTVYEGRLASYTLDPETNGVWCITLDTEMAYVAKDGAFFIQGAGWRGS
jgi:hypothetical protein